jgi:hypothetical protein
MNLQQTLLWSSLSHKSVLRSIDAIADGSVTAIAMATTLCR